MEHTYNEVAEILWEKLAYRFNKLDLASFDLTAYSPTEKFIQKNPFVQEIITNIEDEYD